MYFKSLVKVYLKPVSNIFAWSLLNNHYHFCVQIKTQQDILYFDTRNARKRDLCLKWKTYSLEELPETFRKVPDSFRQWQFMFNAYAKYFNKKYKRRGRIFEKTFGIREIENNEDLKGVIRYINFNPEKHSLVKNFKRYKHSSFHEITNNKNEICDADKVLDLFGGLEAFVYAHETNG